MTPLRRGAGVTASSPADGVHLATAGHAHPADRLVLHLQALLGRAATTPVRATPAA